MEQWFYLLQSSIENLDSETQELIYHSFYQFVYKDIYFMIHDRATTEDIIQEAFLKATTHGPLLRSDSSIQGWIKRITRNVAIDWLRKSKRDREMIDISSVNINAASVAREVEMMERNELLYQTLNELKPNYRVVLLMFYIEGKSYKEICQELHMTEPVLTQCLARARRKMLNSLLKKRVDYYEW